MSSPATDEVPRVGAVSAPNDPVRCDHAGIVEPETLDGLGPAKVEFIETLEGDRSAGSAPTLVVTGWLVTRRVRARHDPQG
jgi:hypothetical protein